MAPLKRYELWTPQGGVLTRPAYQQGWIPEVTEPLATNTGLAGFNGTLTNVNANQTNFTTDDEIIEGYQFNGSVQFRADNVTLRYCRIRGDTTTTPTDGRSLVDCGQSTCTNAYIHHCEIGAPQFAHWNWDNGIGGHDFTAEYNNIHHVVDGIGVFNATVSGDFATNTAIRFNYIHDLAYWTASAGGVVHPQDPTTHNDAIQHHEGHGTIIQGNAIHGKYARQYGHWFCTGNPAIEPYTSIALQSLAAGNPGYGGPFHVLPNRGSGTEATGRYNVAGANGEGSLACLLLDNVGGATSYDLEILGNWFYGAEYAINGGGNAYPGGGQFLGNFHRNRFSRDQGDQGSGGNGTQTINLQGGGWTGRFSAPTSGANMNYYMDNGAAITVRS